LRGSIGPRQIRLGFPLETRIPDRTITKSPLKKPLTKNRRKNLMRERTDDLQEPRDDGDEGEMTEEGLSDLYERARAEDLLEGDPGHPMDHLWISSSSNIREYFDDEHRPTKKLHTRERVEFEGDSTRRENSSLIWRNGLSLVHDWRVQLAAPLLRPKVPDSAFPFHLPTIEMLLASLQVMQTVPTPNHSPDDFLGLLGLKIAPI
jgi:hypothetical protein